MADISDVEEALCQQIMQAVYPLGLQEQSATGKPVKIYRGWPASKTLNADLLAGTQTVTVFSKINSTRDTSRYPRVWRTISETSPQLTVSTAGNTATIEGNGGAGQYIGLIVDGVAYSYGLKSVDTPATTAQALAEQIPQALVFATSIMIPGARSLLGRVVGSGIAEMETRRQVQGIVVSVWCSTPSGRDSLANAIDNALADIDWISLADGTVGRLLYQATVETDESENANLYRRNLDYTIEYPTTLRLSAAKMLFGVGTMSGIGPQVGFGCLLPGPALVMPPLGAIRFDAWYDPANTIDQQCASALSPPAYRSRLPANAVVQNGTVSWPLATQATMDLEISAAIRAGLAFWAFDSYQPDDSLSLALALYLSSPLRSKLKFCMLGQSSNWGVAGQDQPSLLRDISMMTQPNYMTVLGGRPLYLVLDASSTQLAGLPAGGVAAAINLVRKRVQAAGGQNPYIVWLSGAALADYSNVNAAKLVGADAAAAYATPRLNGAVQPYSSLVNATEQDWAARITSGFSMLPTAMTGWDQRPLIQNPQPFYPISSELSMNNYYETASCDAIATHVVGMIDFINKNPIACPAQIGLIYAWNELAEGGWLTPTYAANGPDVSRITSLAEAIDAAKLTSGAPSIALIR